MSAAPLLSVEGVETAYGTSQVLFGMSLQVARGEVVTLIGRNGMGKTTTVKSVMGMLHPKAGRVVMDGRELQGQPSYRVARAGLALVPEGRQIVPNLTVRENLVSTAENRRVIESSSMWSDPRLARAVAQSIVSATPGGL